MKKFLFAIATVAVMASCQSDDLSSYETLDSSANGGISFGSSAISTKAYDTTWETNDQVGIYMVATDETAVSYDNYLYSVKAGGASAQFVTLTSGIYFPEESNATFFAYYPYTTEMSEGTSASGITGNIIYPADVRDQSDLPAIDLMTGIEEDVAREVDEDGGEEQTQEVNFTFEHQLSKIVLQVKADTSTELYTIDGLSGSFGDLYTTADYNIVDDTFTNLDDLGALALAFPEGEAAKLAAKGVADIQEAVAPLAAEIEAIVAQLGDKAEAEYYAAVNELLAEAEAALEVALLAAAVDNDVDDVKTALDSFESSLETINGYLVTAGDTIETIEGYSETLTYVLELYYGYLIALDSTEEIYDSLVAISDAMDALYANDTDYQEALVAYQAACDAYDAASGFDLISTGFAMGVAWVALESAESAIINDIDTDNPVGAYEEAYAAALAALEATDFYKEYGDYASSITSPLLIDGIIYLLSEGVESAEGLVSSVDIADYIDIESLIGVDLSQYGIDLDSYLDLSQYNAEDVETILSAIETLNEILATLSTVIIEVEGVTSDLDGVSEEISNYLAILEEYLGSLIVTDMTIEAMIIPQESTGDLLSFASPLYGEFSVEFPEKTFEGGYVYTYIVTIGLEVPEVDPEPEVVVTIEAVLYSTISDWAEGNTEENLN